MTCSPFDASAGSQSTPGMRLRALLDTDEAIVAPGVYDATSAALTRQAGFPLLYASGGSVVRSLGLPDLGIADQSQMAARFLEITAAAKGVPVIADADNGFGNELNVTRTVQLYEQVGVAGVHIEDQSFPKRCGLYAGLDLIPAESMAAKIRAAVKARRDPDTVIIARTDAFKEEGLARALDRARLYVEAGADMLFVEGIVTAADLEAVGRALPGPKILNTVPTRPLPMDRRALAALGFKVVIFPADLQCAAMAAITECLAVLARDGNSAEMRDRLTTLADRDALVDLAAWQSLAD